MHSIYISFFENTFYRLKFCAGNEARVAIKNPSATSQSDYINASYIDVSFRKSFLCQLMTLNFPNRKSWFVLKNINMFKLSKDNKLNFFRNYVRKLLIYLYAFICAIINKIVPTEYTYKSNQRLFFCG